MQTPVFNGIIGKRKIEKKARAIRNLELAMLVFAWLSMLSIPVLYMGFEVNSPENTVRDTVAIGAFWMLVFSVFKRDIVNEAENKKKQIDKLLKIFKDEIATKYEPTDIKNASMMGEFVLGYMSNEEKGKIKKLCAETDFSDYASAKSFIEQIKQIVKPVFTRNPGLDKLLKDIANGQTYMFSGWRYNQSGHGGR